MSADDRPDPADRAELPVETDEVTSPRRRIVRILVRALIMAIGLVVAGVALAFAFDDISLSEVFDAIRGLDDAETIALIAGTVGVIWAEALLTASVVEGLPARRGALAWLGPTAVASVIPGPSDMPLRYRMFGSWGYDAATAGTAVAASALLNIALKLVLPAIAGIGIAVADIPLEGFFSTIVTAAVMLGVFLAVAAFVLGTERRTAAAGRALDRIWNPTLRLLRREVSGPALADRLVAQRERSLDQLQGRWPYSVASLGMVTVTRVALFVMCIRFAGVAGRGSGVARDLLCVGDRAWPHDHPDHARQRRRERARLRRHAHPDRRYRVRQSGHRRGAAVPAPHLAAADPCRRRGDRPVAARTPAFGTSRDRRLTAAPRRQVTGGARSPECPAVAFEASTLEGRAFMIKALLIGIVVFLIATFPATWLLMLFLGNVGVNVGYWGVLPLGILVSALIGGVSASPYD